MQTVQDHTAPINCIATLKSGRTQGPQVPEIFATGAADATIKIWAFDGTEVKVLQTIKTSPKYFPLAVALSTLGGEGDDNDGVNSTTYILASAGTRHTIQVYTGTLRSDPSNTADFTLQATLSGHEGWIRSLDFTREDHSSPSGDLLLASASQDKYIRLWRVHQGTELPTQAAAASDPTVGAYLPGKSPSNKAYRFRTCSSPQERRRQQQQDYSVTFESLLFNHDDWIYSAKWHTKSSPSSPGTLQLLSTSADNSLAIWESDPTSGIWVTTARLGEISREKGATTATGSIGGFWTGLWSPSGDSVLTLGRTGSWRRWEWDPLSASWAQRVSVSGHVRPVTGVAWARPSGSYLLSTGADQTTRLHAPWATRNGDGDGDGHAAATWHEMARPQIHGYDLNCVDALSETRFVSGADEKLMRVFTEPRAVARMLHAVAGIPNRLGEGGDDMPDAANMPVLGLSNKATVDSPPGQQAQAATNGDGDGEEGKAVEVDPATVVRASALGAARPPFEESLSRHTLWPEAEKLYGHGYEISCLAASGDGGLVASACRASSLNHAVVRVFETARWTELRPPLAAHALTATRLRFGPGDGFLLSVGRDRQWAVFRRKKGGAAREGEMPYALMQAEPKGHARMILDCAWAPAAEGQGQGRRPMFATGGRDKSLKIWAMGEDEEEGEGEGKFGQVAAVSGEHPVTAVDFLPRRNSRGDLVLASGTEAGHIRIHTVKVSDGGVQVVTSFTLKPE